MKVVIALDSFKGSLDSLEAGLTVKEALRAVFPDATVRVFPLADGGEGTADALTVGLGGEIITCEAADPLGRRIMARYGILPCGSAVIEMASCAGLPLLSAKERDPRRASTFGVGEMIADALARGCRRFLIGIGGSATNDGGAGMLQALGFDLLDGAGNPISLGCAGLNSLHRIGTDRVLPSLKDCTFRVACDVDSPLLGARGATAVFAPQKGADGAMIPELEVGLSRFAQKTREVLPHADPDAPGAGAAGGLGFALQAYLGATLERGSEIVIAESGLSEAIADADLVITGEGRLDAQSAMGKAPITLARQAKKHGACVIALCGCVGEGAAVCADAVDAYFPILPAPMTASEAMEKSRARKNLYACAEQVFRLIKATNATLESEETR